jgi:hypothetical protein
MVLIKNVTTTTSKGDQYLRAQHYTILTKVVDEAIQIRLLQLHSKLSSAQFAFKEVNSFSFLYIIQCFFRNLHINHQTKPNAHLMINYIKNNVVKNKFSNFFFLVLKKIGCSFNFLRWSTTWWPLDVSR